VYLFACKCGLFDHPAKGLEGAAKTLDPYSAALIGRLATASKASVGRSLAVSGRECASGARCGRSERPSSRPAARRAGEPRFPPCERHAIGIVPVLKLLGRKHRRAAASGGATDADKRRRSLERDRRRAEKVKVREQIKAEKHAHTMALRRAFELPDVAGIVEELLERPEGQPLEQYGRRITSQHGEDGITVELLRRIGMVHRRGVELGCGGTGVTREFSSRGWGSRPCSWTGARS
jgi:hypothetical protein